jgi:hypothetical protein
MILECRSWYEVYDAAVSTTLTGEHIGEGREERGRGAPIADGDPQPFGAEPGERVAAAHGVPPFAQGQARRVGADA